jgi:fatty-acyl-CoA synthase
VWDAGYAFREGFGLTECGPNCFATTEHLARARPGTVGYPVQHLQMRLAPSSRGHPASERIGELQLRGPQLFGGYFNAPQKTADVLTPDGWLRTGDLARRDADGMWSICGRQSDVFISGGENVYLGEVEAALLGCHGVAAASVVAVPDSRWGEVGVAVLVRAPGREPVQGARVLAEVRTRLAGYKVPRDVVFVDALPQLGSGKIDRRAVAALVRPTRHAPSSETA